MRLAVFGIVDERCPVWRRSWRNIGQSLEPAKVMFASAA